MKRIYLQRAALGLGVATLSLSLILANNPNWLLPLSEFIAIFGILTASQSDWKDADVKIKFIWAIVFMGLADIHYSYVRIFPEAHLPESLALISQIASCLAAGFALVFMLSGISKRASRIKRDFVFLIPSSIIALALNTNYVLWPYFNRESSISFGMGLTSIIFNVAITITSVLSIRLSLQLTSYREFLLVAGLGLFGFATIALSYHEFSTAAGPEFLVNHEAIWAIAYMLILGSFSIKEGEMHFWSPNRAHDRSIRGQLVSRFVISSVLISIILSALGVFSSISAFHVSSVLYGIFGSWIASNLLAINFNKKFELLLSDIRLNNERMRTRKNDVLGPLKFSPTVYEFDSVLDAYNETILFANQNVKEKIKSAESEIRNQSISRVASQVSHDIRSPLSALEMIGSTLSEVSEEKRVIIRKAINRIRDIANSLTKSSKNLEPITSTETVKSTTICFLGPLIDEIVTEKRTEYREKLEIDIDFSQTAGSYGIFVEINISEFKRVISNLVNNAVESLANQKGLVRVITRRDSEKMIAIVVEDNGIGIPNHIVETLGLPGKTFNKMNGQGIGLAHAIENSKNWGGSLQINSRQNQGTKVTISLPSANAPNWFVPEISFNVDQILIVLDDDQSIHDLWEQRVKQISELQSNRISIFHAGSPTDFRKLYQNHFLNSDRECKYLVDYELIGHSENGLTIIKELGIQSSSILVTSRFDEEIVIRNCELLNLKLLPKSMVREIPIRIQGHADE